MQMDWIIIVNIDAAARECGQTPRGGSPGFAGAGAGRGQHFDERGGGFAGKT